MNFTLHLPVNQAVQLDLTGLLKSVNRLIDMVGSVFRTKVIRYFHQVIQGGNIDETSFKSEIASELKEKVLTDENKKKAKKGLKIAAIIFGVIFLIDVISMIVYVSLYGFPQ